MNINLLPDWSNKWPQVCGSEEEELGEVLIEGGACPSCCQQVFSSENSCELSVNINDITFIPFHSIYYSTKDDLGQNIVSK